MDSFERLNQVFARVGDVYPIYVVLIELAIIWSVIYLIVRFLRGTRGARVIKGAALILIVFTLVIQLFGEAGKFDRITYLSQSFFGLAALALVIVFQPELRRGLMRVGEARLFRAGGLKRARVIEQVLATAAYLSRNKIGALIAFERQVGLGGIVEAGTTLDAVVSTELLNTIFWPGSALHDMGVVIRGERVLAAGVQFPLAEGDQLTQELGSRHRSAVGLSQESDALVVIISEETGTISIAERGELHRHLTTDDLRSALTRGLAMVNVLPEAERETHGPEAAETPGAKP